MSKYQIYKNKRNRYHPSISISIEYDKTWKNYEITDSPTRNDKYVKLTYNPNRRVDKNKPAYVRKYLRKDKLFHRGELLSHYELYPEDEYLIDNLLVEREANIELNKKKNGVKRLNHIGNQASTRCSEESPSRNNKSQKRRKRKHNHLSKK